MGIRKVLGLLSTVVLAACGGSAEYAKSSYAPSYGGGGGYGGAAPESIQADTGGHSAAAPTAMESRGGGGESRSEALNQAPERPGLGTGWGETRVSRVHEVSFDRETSTPFAVGMLHYNDRSGVEALASYHQAVAGGFMHDVPQAGGAITVSIVGENGAPLDALKVGDRTFVIGHDGERYSIVMTNHTNHRFESVATVDGLDVVNGRPASLDNRGYILAPFARLEIDGFRQSQAAVAAFRFSRTSQSYAAQTSGDRNVGVIGVAFFSERGDSFTPWTLDELHTRDTANPFPVDLRFAQPPR
jgi:hypothetical protein